VGVRPLSKLAPLPVAVGASVGLLLLLGTLQYQWAGQLSDAERTEIRASAQARAQALARDFDHEITRAFLGLHLDSDTVRDSAFDRFAERYERWRSRAAHPAIVKAVFLVEPSPGSARRLSRFDPAKRTFVPVEWPVELAGLRSRVEPLFSSAGPGARSFHHGGPGDFLDDDVPAFTLPVLSFPGEGRPAPTAPSVVRVAAVEIVELDLENIRGELLPLLAERHFAGGPADAYDLVVARPREGGTLVWRSRPGAPLVASGDAAASLLSLRLEDASPEDFPSPRLFFTREAQKPRPAGPEGGARRFDFVSAGVPGRHGGESGRWRLVATHRAGSIDHVVAAARRRNLAVSFGILALLGASTALVVVTAQRARRLGERQIEFVAGVSHELRTPLAVLCSAGENLADGVVGDPQQVRRYGALVRDQGRRLAEMVEQVLALAGTYSGHPVYDRRLLGVEPLVDEAIEACAGEARSRGFAVVRQIAGDLPPVAGDAGALRRALQNLLTNALKHGEAGRWLTVRAEVAAGARPEVRITVADRGRGIPKEERVRIFEPFFRGREALTAQTHGFGLGLSLVKRVMEAHGGRVTVESAPGQGAAFTLHLPVARDSESGVREAAPDVPHPAR